MKAERGPKMTECAECHNNDITPDNGIDDFDAMYQFSLFGPGVGLLVTDVCDRCHSRGGFHDGVNDDAIGAKYGLDDQGDPVLGINWDEGVYSGGLSKPGKEKWCVGCHDDDATAGIDGVRPPDVRIFWTHGHGRSGRVACTDCHDITSTHIDGEARTYSFNSAYYGPTESGIAYREGYRLKLVNGQVPLMIPCNYNITFSYDAGLMRDTAFRLCFSCHDETKLLDDTPGDGIDSNFKASLPNPPRNYSYAWGSGAVTNEHVAHIMNYIGPFADSDWDTGTTGPGGQNGRDTMTACSNCHNVHGALGAELVPGEFASNEVMIRDGSLSGRDNGGYGFSYVIEDIGEGGYPMVTSTGATQATSVGAIFRNNTEVDNMCGGSMCHGNPSPPPGSSYDATGSSWGSYLEYYRPYQDYNQ